MSLYTEMLFCILYHPKSPQCTPTPERRNLWMSVYTYIHRSGCVCAIFIVACIKFAVDSGANGLEHFFVASSACGHLKIEID